MKGRRESVRGLCSRDHRSRLCEPRATFYYQSAGAPPEGRVADLLGADHLTVKTPALQRLELKGLVEAEWRRTENNRRAKYYELTALGRDRVEMDVKQWRRFSVAVELILQTG